MAKQILIYGGSFNPSGLHHRLIAQELAPHFDEVIVPPCGPRKDKLSVTDVDAIHRAVMADLALARIPKVRVDLFDLEADDFTVTRDLDARYRAEGDVWHFVGADLVKRGEDGLSAIQREWQDGPDIWNRLRWAVGRRAGYELDPKHLPPHSKVIELTVSGSSTEIRDRVFHRKPFAHLTTPEVAAYIERYNLYRGARPASSGPYPIDVPRMLIEKAADNEKADRLEKLLAPYADAKDPNVIVVLGGDGSMLRAIRKHWRKRLPFVGFNAGHVGFLHNEPEHAGDVLAFFARMRTHHLPLLRVDALKADGTTGTDYAFNDVWLQRRRPAIWTEVSVNGVVRVPKLVCDAVVAATPAGSTGYARSMGATPMNLDRPAIALAASAVDMPRGWRHAELPGDADIEFRVLESGSRPAEACFDDASIGAVERLRVRTSLIASVELAFAPDNDLAEKRIASQFPEASRS